MDVKTAFAGPDVSGVARLYRLLNPGRGDQYYGSQQELLSTHRNQHQYYWGHIVSRLLRGERDYRLGAMYFEFENVADPEDPVTVPTYGREEGLEYYTDLSLSAVRDFVRAPLSISPMLGIVSGYEDYFESGVSGNQLTVFCQTQGTTGFHGKAFSAGSNSKVFGAALVATPDFGDQSQDIVFARLYFEVAEQAVKTASSQFGIQWDLKFK